MTIYLCCIRQIGEKKFFYPKDFLTNQNSRKNQIQLFDFFSFGIERPVDTGAEKILLTFIVFSKCPRKIFFFQDFSSNQILRKN